jgi:hypothetical protein
MPGATVKMKVSADGTMEDGENFKDYIAKTMNVHGRQNVNYSHELLQ